MRTIVVFHADNLLWYQELQDSPRPVVGDTTVYLTKRYEVLEVAYSLGANDVHGVARSGNSKLLEILNAYFGETNSVALLALLTNIGSGDASKISQGGLVAPGSGLMGEFDNVIFVRLKAKKLMAAIKLVDADRLKKQSISRSSSKKKADADGNQSAGK